MINDVLTEADSKMDKSVQATREEFATIRAGRAHPSMFNKILVDYYGTPTPLQQNLRVVDAAAFSLCMDNKLPMVVFSMERDGSIARAVRRERIGTLVTAERDR